RPPGRVLPAEVQGGLKDRRVGLGSGLPASVVRGEEGIRSAEPEAAEQAPDGARGQAQGGGDGRAILALAGAAPDGLADRDRGGGGGGGSAGRSPGRTAGLIPAEGAPAGRWISPARS